MRVPVRLLKLNALSMPTNMILSPMQRDYLDRGEFDDFSDDVDERFDRVDESLKHIDKKLDGHISYTKNGFEKVFEQIDNVESTLISRIDTVESNLGKKIDIMAGDVSWLKRSMGKFMKKAEV